MSCWHLNFWLFLAAISAPVNNAFISTNLHLIKRKPIRVESRSWQTASVTEDESSGEATILTSSSAGSSISSIPDMKAYANGYRTVFEELPFRKCKPSFGKIPKDLVGSYFRCGPAMFSAGSIVPPKTSIVQPRQKPVPDGQDPDRMVLHPFEGDGAVLGVTFSSELEDGEEEDDRFCSARFRFVRTVAFTNERKKGARIYMSMDSTRQLGAQPKLLANDFPLPLFRHHLQPGLNKNRKNTSNTRAIYWGKRLFTLWEGGQPYKLDARACSTEGRSRLGGAILRDNDPFGSKLSYDSRTHRALFYGVEPNAKSSAVTLYEFDSDFRLIPGGRTTVSVPGFALWNDFGTTENYAVFIQPDISVDNVQFMINKEPGKSLSLGEGNTVLHLIPRVQSSKGQQISIRIPREPYDALDANAQICNAYEDGDTLIVDAILSAIPSSKKGSASPPSWPWSTTLNDYQAVALKKSLWRYTVDTKKRTVTKTRLFDDHCLFGTVNSAVSSQKHRYIYVNIGSLGPEVAPPQGIARIDCNTSDVVRWLPKNSEFCGEPIFAKRRGQQSQKDDGYILSILYCGKRNESELLIFLADDISGGPITRIPLGMAIPHGFFGCFTAEEDAAWSADALERRAKLADKIESRGNIWNEVKSDFSGLGLRFDDMEEYFGEFFS